ncbi:MULTISPECIES: HAD family phosphatase [Streptomyces]|uniref:HAD-IA family hydrolase n=1 Tax=Streptomyces lycii TaxID=2654337 RepID=A0ABQ7FDR5_9ACTN|nr:MULTISPECIES: HAD-IA family hydrolase [Streptomyces]KAF4407191.1 HAD-IA family hydrolase [Streptomyces lycii]PGH47702.1 hydrolase [Streptomyces sp. Ru87]
MAASAEPRAGSGTTAPAGGTAPRERPSRVLGGVRALVLDTDGVITDSARVHAAAWKEAFDAALRDHPPADPAQRRPFDAAEDYRRHVDGKSRLDGAAAFLASRAVGLPEGDPEDPPGTDTVRAVAALKDRLFTERLRAGGIEAYPGTVRLLRAMNLSGTPCAAASASRHAPELLESAGVREMVDAVVDGAESARLGLPGKPDPALFLEAARRLDADPGEAAVVEDALAGVEAGRRGGFGLVIGVDRAADAPGADPAAEATAARDLHLHGADVVVRDLAELLEPPGPEPAGGPP